MTELTENEKQEIEHKLERQKRKHQERFEYGTYRKQVEGGSR